MKYIRTKNGIAELVELDENHIYLKIGNRIAPFTDTSAIIKQADTIEELCDEFVIANWKEKIKPLLSKKKENNTLWFVNNLMMIEGIYIPDLLKTKTEIYGAIWTDKGLIYVAKLNEKGELELL